MIPELAPFSFSKPKRLALPILLLLPVTMAISPDNRCIFVSPVHGVGSSEAVLRSSHASRKLQTDTIQGPEQIQILNPLDREVRMNMSDLSLDELKELVKGIVDHRLETSWGTPIWASHSVSHPHAPQGVTRQYRADLGG